MQSLATLRAAVTAAERAAADLLLSDDMACVTGAYDRALAVVRRCHADLALAEEMQRLMPRTPAALIAEIERTRKEAAS